MLIDRKAHVLQSHSTVGVDLTNMFKDNGRSKTHYEINTLLVGILKLA